MKNKYSKFLVLLTIMIFVLSIVSAEASREDNKAKSENNKAKEPLDKITFIHYRDGTVKQIGNEMSSNGGKCYKLLGVKWSSLPVDYVIGSADASIASAISASTKTWGRATSKNLFGSYTTNLLATWDTLSPDGQNAYVFGPYGDPNVIAVTNIWYTIYSRQIVDYDVLFNTYYTWGDATNPLTPNVMDVQNIATHETGHGLGLADIYQTSCSLVTMYGYASIGETLKRDLAQPDITGLQRIYGA